MVDKALQSRMDILITIFRLLSLVLFSVFLYSTFSLIQYQNFLKFGNMIYLFILLKYFLIFILRLFFVAIAIISRILVGKNVGFLENFELLPLVGLTSMNDDLLSFLNNPVKWLTGSLSNIIVGILSLIFLIIPLLTLGYLNRGKMEYALWVFLLAEMALVLSLIFGYQTFKPTTIRDLGDFLASPLFWQAIISIIFLESMAHLSYFSTFLIPARDRIRRNIVFINRFEKLTPQEISIKISEELGKKRIVEKLSPVASLFTSEYVIAPLEERVLSTQFLAKIKTYYDFMKDKDPEIESRIIGEKSLSPFGKLLSDIIISFIIRLFLTIVVAFAVLQIPQMIGGAVLRGIILESSYIEVYILYIGTIFLLLYVIGELLERL